MTNPRPDLYPNIWVGLEGFAKQTPLDQHLVACIRDSDRWLEHGIIEHRLMVEHEWIYYEMISRAGHNSLGVPGNTASNYIGQRLYHLGRKGMISVNPDAPTTGYWKRIDNANHVAGPESPLDTGFYSWHDYAVDNGLDPYEWEFTRPAPE